jgi:heme A synthase
LPLYGIVLLLLLIIQAGLGGVTVLDRNSPWSVALHLSTALVLFSVLWLIFERAATAIDRSSVSPDHDAPRSLALISLVVWLLAIGTMASAAMTAKSGASLACSTWPLCDGAIIPDLGDPLIRLHIAHRWLALATAIGVVLLFFSGRSAPHLKRLAHGALMLIICEIALGATVVILEVPIWTAVAHQALGVLTFAYITRIMWRAVAKGQSPDAMTIDAEPDTAPAATRTA